MALHWYARLTVAACFLLLIAGGLVTSTDSGLAVPDWPLSHGQLFPPMEGGTLYEHGHRLIAGSVGLLILVLAVWLWMREPRRWVKWLGTAALGAVIVQAVLGGITVLMELPKPVSISHAFLGQAVFCLLVAIALFTSRGWLREERGGTVPARMRTLAALATASILLQLVLGAMVRHGATGVWPHIVGACIVLGMTLAAVAQVYGKRWEDGPLRRPALLVLCVLPLQILLGLATWMLTLKETAGAVVVAHRTAHVALGAFLLGASLVLTLRLYGREVEPAAVAEGAPA